jgi:hypothetical protein
MNTDAPAQTAGPVEARPRTPLLIGIVLRVATAAALIIDAVVHFQDAHFYDPNVGSLLSQGQLFRIQGVVAIVLAVAVLAVPRRVVWVVAFLVAASAFGAVVLYTYVNVGPLAGLPNMYEPSWGPPGKLFSAYAEGAGAVLALGGLAWAWTVHRTPRR